MEGPLSATPFGGGVNASAWLGSCEEGVGMRQQRQTRISLDFAQFLQLAAPFGRARCTDSQQLTRELNDLRTSAPRRLPCSIVVSKTNSFSSSAFAELAAPPLPPPPSASVSVAELTSSFLREVSDNEGRFSLRTLKAREPLRKKKVFSVSAEGTAGEGGATTNLRLRGGRLRAVAVSREFCKGQGIANAGMDQKAQGASSHRPPFLIERSF